MGWGPAQKTKEKAWLSSRIPLSPLLDCECDQLLLPGLPHHSDSMLSLRARINLSFNSLFVSRNLSQISEKLGDSKMQRDYILCWAKIACTRKSLSMGPICRDSTKAQKCVFKKCTDCQHHGLTIMLASYLLLYIEGGANFI